MLWRWLDLFPVQCTLSSARSKWPAKRFSKYFQVHWPLSLFFSFASSDLVRGQNRFTVWVSVESVHELSLRDLLLPPKFFSFFGSGAQKRLSKLLSKNFWVKSGLLSMKWICRFSSPSQPFQFDFLGCGAADCQMIAKRPLNARRRCWKSWTNR